MLRARKAFKIAHVVLFVFSFNHIVNCQYYKLNFDNYTTADGLSDNYINSVFQDNKGWIWIATGMGIERFDGIKFKQYGIQINDSIIKEDILIRNFFESKNGNLYVCAEEYGLALYNRKSDVFKRVKINNRDILSDVSVKDIVEDKFGNLWAATKKGICKIDLKNQKIVWYSYIENKGNSIISNYVRRLAFDDDSYLWIGTQRGLEKFDPSTNTFVHYSKINPLLNDDILDIFIDNKKRIWVGTGQNGIIILSNKGKDIRQFVPDPKNERSYKVNSIYQDNENKFWIGTRGGLYLYTENGGNTVLFENNPLEEKSLIHNSVMNICQDKKGDIWIATRAGLSYLAKEKQVFECYKAYPNNNHYLNNSEIYCIWMDKSAKIWLGTESGGINILDRKSGTFNYLMASGKNGLSTNCIKSIASLGDGKILIGTFQGGLNIYNEKTGGITWLKHDKSDKRSISSNIIWDICVDKKGCVWVGTSVGLDKFDPITSTFTHFSEFDNKVNGVTWIGVDSDNDLWIGSENIYIFRTGEGILKTFSEKGRDFYEDSKGRYWVMTGNRGIVLYDKNKGAIKLYNEQAGIASKLAYSMLEDNSGKLWISTANGLSCFDPQREIFKNYFNFNGLQGNQFHYGASFRAKSGELLFGGVNGLNIFNPDKIFENKYSPPVYITDLKIFNQSVKISHQRKSILKETISETSQLTVPYKYNVLTFEFAALNYTNSKHNNYKYMLEGFDKGWTATSENRTATYTNLDPGEYNFRVIASNDNGLWNTKGASKKIVILPPFHKTVWFGLLVFCMLILILILIFNFILKRRELKNALEFEKVKAQKLHELDNFKLQFFTNISHEIKTPLTLIISPLKKILKHNISDTLIKENLKIMERNAEHLMKLITQLLDYRKLQDGKLTIESKSGDIVQFCMNVFLSFEGVMLDKGIQYKFSSIQKKIIANFDPDKLKNILNNLISNAIRYNKQDGSILFAISMVFESEKEFDGKEERYIKIVVKDSGIGINEKEIPNLFNRYYSKSTGKEISSSGIGLAFTRELVELHKGKIYFESKEGLGSVFTVLLPLIEDSIEITGELRMPELSTKEYIKTKEFELDQKNRPILLVVEDNEDVRRFIQSHFTNGFIILEAVNGKEGLDLAIKTIPDIIVSDIMMPLLNGKEFCEKIKKDERTSHIPIILLTALSSKVDVKAGLIKGADDYITKPFDIDMLQTKIENLLSIRKSLREKYSKQIILEPSHVSIKNPDEKFLEKTIKIIEENMDDSNLDIDKLVNQIGVSRMQLYRKIDALTNMTVKEFVNDIRLKRAAQLLSGNKINVSEVAYSVGFNDLSYFGKCFKRKFGINASEYNLKARSNSK